jgi:hypothetical protein
MRRWTFLVLFFAIAGGSSSTSAASAVTVRDTGERKSPITGGVRLALSLYDAENAYLNYQLSRFNLQDRSVAAGLTFCLYVTGWNYYLEAEFEGATGSPAQSLFEGGTHNVRFRSVAFGLWFRRGFNDIIGGLSRRAPRIDILPGVSASYVSDTSVIMQEDGQEDWEGVLSGEGWGYAVGAVVRWSWFFVEYRYKWWRITDAWTRNGGDFFFPGNPELDFSGHFIGIGIGWGGDLEGDE